MHGVFEELLVVLTERPTVGFHLGAEFVEAVGCIGLRVFGLELTALTLGKLNEFGSNGSGQLARLAENHIPDVVGDEAPALLALLHLHDVHKGEVLDILAEWGHEAGIAYARPYVCYFIEQLDEQVVGGELGLTVLFLPAVEALEILLEVGHQRTHHAAGKTWLDEQRVVEVVESGDIVAEEVVHHLLNLGTHFHISLHVDVLHLEACILEHFLYGDDVGVAGAPRKG